MPPPDSSHADPASRSWRLARDDPPRIMGVVNVTPDSFSGDGLLGDPDAAVALARRHVDEGAEILDVGGESTRPGAEPVTVEEETRRVIPVVDRICREVDAVVSVDTTKAEVARRALAAGARIVNDVSGLRELALARVAGEHGAWLVLTHNRWEVRAREDRLGGYYPRSAEGDVVEEVAQALLTLTRQAIDGRVPGERLILDPGLGFGKSPHESLELLKRLAELRERVAPFPLLVGPSRKSFVGRALGLPVDQRLEGTLACVAIAAFAGTEVVRVHDVAPAVRAAKMAWAIRRGRQARLLAG